MKRLLALALAGLTVAATTPVAPGFVQSRAAVSMGSQSQLINLPRCSSIAVDLPADARDVIVPKPTVAYAMLHSPPRPTIIAPQPGETHAFLLARSRTPHPAPLGSASSRARGSAVRVSL